MTITTVSGALLSTPSGWPGATRGAGSSATYGEVAAAVAAQPPVPAQHDQSWMTKNLSAQDRATIAAATGVRFGASGSVLVPMSASPDESLALQKAVHLLNAQRGGFPKDLTPEEVLRIVQQNAPGGAEPLEDWLRRKGFGQR